VAAPVPADLARAIDRCLEKSPEARFATMRELHDALAPEEKAATDADWDTEYLELILSVAIVPSLDDAVAFIARHGTQLAESIVTEDYAAARRFLAAVDAACVFANASTRFTDGFEFGFGAEVGISTNRLHARGPMGLRELTTYKYQVLGSGQIRT